MRLSIILVAATSMALAVLPSPALASPEHTLQEVEACSRQEALVKEVPAACYFALALHRIEGKTADEAIKILNGMIADTPKAAELAKPALENLKKMVRIKHLDDKRNALVQSLKEAEDFISACIAGSTDENVANCRAAVKRLLEYTDVKLLKPPIDLNGLVNVASGAKAEFAETPSGGNADIQIVAGMNMRDNICSPPVGFPDGILKFDPKKEPGDEKGLIVDGETAAARAACGDIAVGIIINAYIPPRGIDAAKIRKIYGRMKKAEEAGKMELAYAFARAYVFILKTGFTGRGLEEATLLSDSCLTGGDIVLTQADPGTGKKIDFPAECSKYKSLRAAVANDFQPGFLSFFGRLTGITCEDLKQRAETGVSPLFPDRGPQGGIRLAGARAYVVGQIDVGVRQNCVEPYDRPTLIKLIRETKSAELREELAGDVWQVFGRDKQIAIYQGMRGLARLLVETSDFDNALKLIDDPMPEVRLAAWPAVGIHWAEKKNRAFNWGQAMTGANEARKRAGAYAHFFPRGLDFVRSYMEPIARGKEVIVEKYLLNGTKAQLREGVALELLVAGDGTTTFDQPSLLAKGKKEPELEECSNKGATSELKFACMFALSQQFVAKTTPPKTLNDVMLVKDGVPQQPITIVLDLLRETAKPEARGVTAGWALSRVLIKSGLTEQNLETLVAVFTSAAGNTVLDVKPPLTTALVEALGDRIAEHIK